MQTIGERLEEARKRKGISIREAAEATKIRSDYLHKFESNQFDIKLPDIYLRGFLRNYANFLKLPGDRIVADFQALGFGEVRSAKALNREVYGRMDISASNAKASGDEAPSSNTAPGLPPSAANATAEQPPRKLASGPAAALPVTARPSSVGSSIAGLNLNRGLLLKTGTLIAGAILLLMLVVWGGVALVRGKKSPVQQPSSNPASAASTSVPTPVGDFVSLIVTNRPTNLKVTRVSDGQVLYQSDTPKPVGFSVRLSRELVTITTDAAENIAIDYRGRRFSHGQVGRREFPVDLNSSIIR
ncbi:helix-turn-helix domain-containing protein [Geminisphaera colitermitum]|uniref:helix-turn-helix domain-containing protein n=1 Tax=Geminisphaera colitermitum TaxID=1148786 RepID=UPI000196515E|nr:helix-turn-helix domain-containing protein [Geminisphaera colitermitum]